jgi:hypothetical protein
MFFTVERDGVASCGKVFNGRPVRSTEWWRKHWADNAEFVAGPVALGKDAAVEAHEALLRSFPDLTFHVLEPLAAQADGTVTAVLEASATHTGAPFAFAPGMEPMPALGVAVKNDPERVTVSFDASGYVVRQVVAPMPGGRGLSGPAGFYAQVGGTVPRDSTLTGALSGALRSAYAWSASMLAWAAAAAFPDLSLCATTRT